MIHWYVPKVYLLLLDAEMMGRTEECKFEKFFLIAWEWCQRGKIDHNKFSAIQLEMRWVGLNLEESKDRYGCPVCVSLAGVTLRLGGGICLG